MEKDISEDSFCDECSLMADSISGREQGNTVAWEIQRGQDKKLLLYIGG